MFVWWIIGHLYLLKSLSPKVFNRFSKSSPQLEDFEGGHLGGKFQVRRYFTFAMARWKLCTSKTFESLPLSTCTRCQEKSYISKAIQPIIQIFASARRCWGWAFGWVVSGAQVFHFAMAWWKLCGSTKFDSLQLSTCTLCQEKSYISKGIQLIFEIFAWARSFWGWAFAWEVSGAQVFYFCIGMVKTLRIDKIWKFTTFNLYTVPGKILYLQRYSTDFRNLCLSPKLLRGGGDLGGKFKVRGILLLQWQGKNLRIDNIWKFATFNLNTVPAKILYLQTYSTDFRNLCLSAKLSRWGGAFEWKVSGARFFAFAMAR